MNHPANVSDLCGLYPVPDELTEEGFDRFNNLDLPKLRDEDLRREITFLRWFNFLSGGEWHLSRELAVAEELARRG